MHKEVKTMMKEGFYGALFLKEYMMDPKGNRVQVLEGDIRVLQTKDLDIPKRWWQFWRKG